MKRLIRVISAIAKRHSAHPFAHLWRWARKGTPRKRLRAIREWAHRHQVLSHSKARRHRFWRVVHYASKLLRRRRHVADGWPTTMHIVELFNNDNGLHNHVHVASTERDKLIQLGKIAVAQYGGAGMVREFPPFDPVECVHVSTSWHYRDSSSPYTPRTCANRGDGLAMDLSFPRRQEFADEIKRRYGADNCDF